MTGELPELYFRVRDNGALVFRVDSDPRQRRLEMEQIASANIRNGEIKPHGERSISEAALRAIRAWIAERQALLAARELDEARRTIDHLNQTAQWINSKASDAQIESLTDPLLLAMHDLRSVLIRRRSEALAPARAEMARTQE